MKWFPKLFGSKSTRPRASLDPSDPLVAWLWGLGSSPTDSGVEINGRTVLNYSSVWQAVNLISGDLACTPLNLFERTDTGKEIDRDHPAQTLLRYRANDMMNSFVIKRLLTSHALLWGMGRAIIVRNRKLDPVGLIPMLPDRSKTEIADGQLWHGTKLGRETEYTWYSDDDTFVVPGLGFDGIEGYSVISLAANSFGLGLACEKHANNSFRNGARGSVVVESTAGALGEVSIQQYSNDFNAHHAGLSNSGKVGFLQPGMTLKPWPTMSAIDAQFLETRAFSRDEVASWFMLPAYKLNSKSQDGFNSTEMRAIEYVNGTLQNWFTAWTEEARHKLLTLQQKRDDSHFFAFDTSQLLRGTQKDRYSSYLIGRQGEFLSADEIRRMENLNDRPQDQLGDFANPFTKSNPAPDVDKEIEVGNYPSQPVAPNPSATNKALIQSRLKELLTVERNRLVTASAKASNFRDWQTGFYDRWHKTLERLVLDLGGEPWNASEYIAESKMKLLALCDTAKPEALEAELKTLTEHWPEQRAAQLAAAISA